MPKPSLVGQRIRRREDPRLMRGLAAYTDDLALPHALHAAFVRSPDAAGRVTRIAVEDALAVPGVRAVVTAEDLRGRVGPTPPHFAAAGMTRVDQPLLADPVVRYVGHPIAIVLAEDRYIARDGAAAVDVEIEPRPAVVEPATALAPDAARVYEELPDNVCQRIEVGSDQVDELFAQAHDTVSLRLEHPRVAPAALDGRCFGADWVEWAQ